MSGNPDYFYENKFCSKYKNIAGIDEAGRGALAGPVVAAAVILPTLNQTIWKNEILQLGIKDSKLLSFKKRLLLNEEILNRALSYKVSFSNNEEIDNSNILKQTIRTMQNASKGLVPQADLLLIDGNYFESNGIPYKTIIGGDRKCISIAAASILAKVSRDLWMIEVADKLYPEYGFSRHKGYGTKEHIMAIKHYGPCLLHRRTFLKKYLSEYFFQMSPGIENSLF